MILRNFVRSFSSSSTLQASTTPTATVIKAGMLVQRIPIILPSLSPFERQYANYKKFQSERKARDFPYRFYFKNKTALLQEFRNLEKGKPADSFDVKKLVELAPRFEKELDVKDLNRKMKQNLYLLVKKNRAEHAWQLPQGHVEGSELLHEAAVRELKEECGDAMETWLAARVPIGHHEYTLPDGKLAKVYFLKSFIVEGNVKPDGKEIVDYAWVTKEEMDQYLDKDLLDLVKKMT